jgi:hypothetical protein
LTETPQPQNTDESPFRDLAGYFLVFDVCAPYVAMGVAPVVALLWPVGLLILAIIPGMVIHQVGVLSFYSVFAPVPWLRRTLKSFGLMTPFVFLPSLVLVARGSEPNPAAALQALLLSPFWFFSLQIPVWAFKWSTGRCLLGTTDDPAAVPPVRQFGISHLLAVTAGVAFVLGLASSAVAFDRVILTWGTLLGASAVLVGWSTLVVIPATVAAFFVDSRRAAVLGLLLCATVTVLPVALFHPAVRDYPPAIAAVVVFHATELVALHASLRFVRRRGYQLVRPEVLDARARREVNPNPP